MKINITHILVTLFVIIGLVATNVYQWQNPTVVEIPQEQTAIDSTAWVKKTVYLDRQSIIDSLRSANENLADKIRATKNRIASYTSINGQLRLQIDSLKSKSVNSIPLSNHWLERDNQRIADTTFTATEVLGNGFLKVSATGIFKNDTFSLDIKKPKQIRPVKIIVVNTWNEDRSRILNYVHSPDFDSLSYNSYTELAPENKLPKFWIGAGAGILGMLAIMIILK